MLQSDDITSSTSNEVIPEEFQGEDFVQDDTKIFILIIKNLNK